MEQENKLENLSFEGSYETSNEDISSKKDSSKKSNNIIILLSFVLIITISSIIILGYFLFFKDSSTSIVTQVEKIEKTEIKNDFNFSLLSKRSDYQVSIYLSAPRKELEYLGEGVVINNSSILTTKDVIKDRKSENLIVKFKNSYLSVILMEGYFLDTTNLKDSDLWVLNLKEVKFETSADILNQDLNLGEEYFLRSTSKDIKGEDGANEVETFYPLRIIGKGEFYYLTNLSSSDNGSLVYDKSGKIVGIASGLDSKNNIKIINEKSLKRIIDSSVKKEDSAKEQNKDKVGIEFEFSDVVTFRKEGRPVGLVVKSLREGSRAQLEGIKAGDTVLTINNQVFVSEEELDKFFKNLNQKEELRFEIIRENKKMGITLNLE